MGQSERPQRGDVVRVVDAPDGFIVSNGYEAEVVKVYEFGVMIPTGRHRPNRHGEMKSINEVLEFGRVELVNRAN